MTLAVSIKVNDGIVLAADSATTIYQTDGRGSHVQNVYQNGNKILNLHKEFPIGIITWGQGSIGGSSIATLVKDFRYRITNLEDYLITQENYTVQSVAESFFNFIKEKYVTYFQSQKPLLGFRISGYNNMSGAEEWEITLGNNGELLEQVSGTERSGASWRGQPEAMTRLVKGYSTDLFPIMDQIGIEQEKISQLRDIVAGSIEAAMVNPAMPIKDAIELAEFYVDTTTKFIRFSPTPHQTVGGPIEIATVTKHEGFKWVQRKLYFNDKFNPKEV